MVAFLFTRTQKNNFLVLKYKMGIQKSLINISDFCWLRIVDEVRTYFIHFDIHQIK